MDKWIVVKKYDKRVFNPNKCLSLSINGVTLQDNTLTISGREAHPSGYYKAPNGFNPNDHIPFTRAIDTDFC